jgi:1-hydroxycarotenoid 3,4-desaturase
MGTSRPAPAQARRRAVVVGAGVGGLSAAALLARAGWQVQLLEAADTPGGKLGTVNVGGQALDAGPTVLTMRWVFEAWFEALGLSMAQELSLQRCEVLARHVWRRGEQLDLLADLEDSVAAVAAFSGGAQAQRYRAFCLRAQEVYQTLEQPFLRQSRPHPLSLAWRCGWRQWPALARISPFTSLWQALGHYFPDPRLRQLFGRYATYCGSSPFTAPATLMLVAHVERDAVWQLAGGLHSLQQAMVRAVLAQGVQLRLGCRVAELHPAADGLCAVQLADGERLPPQVVIFCGDVAALHTGALGSAVQQALAPGGVPAHALDPARRSLSAVTWHVQAEASGMALSHHNVLFSDPQHEGYRAEFDTIAQGGLPAQPTVYLCAQDRPALRTTGPAGPRAPERLMCLVNAPARADRQPLSEEALARCEEQMWARLAQAGLKLRPTTPALRRTPADFAQRYPATGGALYGGATMGWRSSFQRPGSRTRLPGLYLAGGSVHPGPGLPMAALSGQLAAQQVLADCPSTPQWHPVVMPGGTSTP